MFSLPVVAKTYHFWKGSSGGYEIEWTSETIRYRKINDRKFTDLHPQLPKIKSHTGEGGLQRVSLGDVEVKAVVGSFVFISGGHLGEDMRTRSKAAVMDISASPATQKFITDFFEDGELAKAISEDGLVKKMAKQFKLKLPFSSLKDFIERFGKIEQGMGNLEEECGFTVEYAKESFFFHHVEGEKVATRLYLGPTPFSPTPCRGASTQLGLLLTVPDGLKPALELAAQEKEGFLAKTAPKGLSWTGATCEQHDLSVEGERVWVKKNMPWCLKK